MSDVNGEEHDGWPTLTGALEAKLADRAPRERPAKEWHS